MPYYDFDGNMLTGPVAGAAGMNIGVPVPSNAALTWDAENRLIKAVVDGVTVNYAYDHLSRLISSTHQPVTQSYLYDGWNRIAEFTGQTLAKTYLWGMDLSGSMQGAGGVGGLLSISDHHAVTGAITARHYPTYDGNGNVSEYLNTGCVQEAHFAYDPFGNLTDDTSGNAASFPYRFSTKPQDAATGLYYYGYRWYDPLTGRWPSRDPIAERGGLNLYGFVGNDGIDSWDYLGREEAAKAKKYDVNLDFESLRLSIGECGGVRWDVHFTVKGANNKPLSGHIIQFMRVEQHLYDCTSEKKEIGKPSIAYLFEGWTVPGDQKDTWNGANQKFYANGDKACKGSTTIVGVAQFVDNLGSFNGKCGKGQTPQYPQNVDTNDPFNTNPQDPWYPADILLPRSLNQEYSKVAESLGDSNPKSRKMEVTWDCCKGNAKSQVKIDGKEMTGEFDHLK